MPVAGGGFEQCYNAQAVVDTDTLLVLVPYVTQAANDKEQVEPMGEQLLADAGYFSERNVEACEESGIEPLIAIKRDRHHLHWSERFSEAPELPAKATAAQRMTHWLKTRAGKVAYGLRKQTVEPVFGIVKSVMGIRSVPHPRTEERPGRVDPGMPGVESQAHGRIVPAVRERPIKTSLFAEKPPFFGQTALRTAISRVKPDRLLGRWAGNRH